MKFRIVHARDVHPNRLGHWYLNRHSASLSLGAMTEAKWREDLRQRLFVKPAREVLAYQSGPRWGIVAEKD